MSTMEYIYGKSYDTVVLTRELPRGLKVSETKFFNMVFIVTFFMNYLMVSALKKGIITIPIFNNILTFYMVGIIASGFLFLPYTPGKFGIHLNNFKYNVLVGLGIGTIGLAFSLTIRYFLYKSGNTSFGFNSNITFFTLTYPLGSFVQETVTKGFLQDYMLSVFKNSKLKAFLSIIASSAVFGVLHIACGIPVIILAFLFSCTTGIVYHKTKSIVGVSIIHFMTSAGLFLMAGF